MLEVGAVTPNELHVLRTNTSWPARVAAAHSIPRELRALNEYAPELARVSAIEMPILMLVGEQTDPFRRGVWEQFASQLNEPAVRDSAQTRPPGRPALPARCARRLRKQCCGGARR
jgi:hypothetical protein